MGPREKAGLVARAIRRPEVDVDMHLREMQKMDKMADSVTKMSEMCQMMMQKEMTGMYYKVAAGVAIAAVLVLALLLLVILEIQWIIYWARLLREQKRP